MKIFCTIFIAGVMLTSCNTTIGVGRDMRDGFLWTKRQIQEANQQNSSPGYDGEYDAPVY